MQSTYLDGHIPASTGSTASARWRSSGVLLIHAQMLTPTPLLAPLGHYGQLGVQLFFFLSGYIIYMAWDRGGTGTAGFYWNRVARIAPLYYLMLVLSYIFGWSMSPDELNTENFVWHLFFAQGFSGGYAYAGISPMWSLTSEIAFYLVFPFLHRLSTRTLLILFAGSLALRRRRHRPCVLAHRLDRAQRDAARRREIHARRHDRLSPSRPVRHALDDRAVRPVRAAMLLLPWPADARSSSSFRPSCRRASSCCSPARS